MIAFIVLSNSVFLAARALDRGRIELVFESNDKKQDFLGSEEVELVLSIFATVVAFMGTNLTLINTSPLFRETNEASQGFLREQSYMQIAQFILYLNFRHVPFRCDSCIKSFKVQYMIYRIQLWMHRIFLGVIPVLSVLHIITRAAIQWDELTSDTNLLRPWLICYPLCQLLLAGTYLGLLDVQLAQTMAPNTIKRIDKVIGREEIDPEAKPRCCGPA